MINEVLKEFDEKSKKLVDYFKQSLLKIRTGRASLALLDGIKVDYYGTLTPLKQIANISIPEARSITVQPWDPTALPEIEKSILKSDLGLTPMNDGKIIRLNIPPLTEERRKEIVKLVKKMAEDSKVSLRNVRREANEKLKEQENKKLITKDDNHKGQENVLKNLEKFIKDIDEFLDKKEKEVMQV